MQNRMIWFERKFKFEFPVDIYPMIVERLRGTPARIEAKVLNLSSQVLTAKSDQGWSIQKQAGHLAVLEELWLSRIDDFLDGKEVLREADLNNRLTKETDFHSCPIKELLAEFQQKRLKLVNRLYELSIDQAGMTALHPRLKQPMRLIDTCYFAAEHDDHHLARMTDLICQHDQKACSRN